MDVRFFHRLFLLSLLFTLAFSLAAYAKLGENQSSIAADIKALSCTQGATNEKSKFKIVSIPCDYGVIREYVSLATGIVFGIDWNGIAHPDLSLLLGIYFADDPLLIPAGVTADEIF